jgi:hypothetical protein
MEAVKCPLYDLLSIIVRLNSQVDILDMLRVHKGINIGTRERIHICKGPTVLPHVWRNDGHTNDVIQTLENSGYESPVSPRTSIRDEKVVSS